MTDELPARCHVIGDREYLLIYEKVTMLDDVVIKFVSNQNKHPTVNRELNEAERVSILK
jgi:hypothetical protein